ncbi:type II toxin-antitoxin system Phd/YefM family antitoxin [Patescibacteria group bacterium]|nr:type II toxin-antitoxin system Phd/YefM family antitoxin [Patescibacteria group bacterium]
MTKKPEFSDEDRQKLDLTGDLSVEELKLLIAERKARLEWENHGASVESIAAEELKSNMRKILDKTKRGAPHVITRKGTEIASLVSFSVSQHEQVGKVVNATDFKAHRGELMDQAREGFKFVITRGGEPVAVLGPPPPKELRSLSETDREKLMLIASFSPKEIAKIVKIIRSGIQLIDLL